MASHSTRAWSRIGAEKRINLKLLVLWLGVAACGGYTRLQGLRSLFGRASAA
jgi:hypothetical protein